MKTKIEQRDTPIGKYPSLYISEGLVVLMASESSGTVVHTENSIHRLGYTSDDWSMDVFKPFEGKLTLEN